MRRRFLGEIKKKNNVIYYTSTDNLIVVPYNYDFGTIMVDNKMSGNVGTMIFLADVTTIGDAAFRYCTNLKSVTIPDSVTTIGTGAFYGCSSLTSIAIPDSVTTIEGVAFHECDSLTSVHITDIAAWCNISFGDQPLSYGADLYLNNELVTELTIPDSVTTIGASAFYDCNSLTSVTIPDSVTTIGYRALYNCSSLTGVYCKATTPPSLGTGVFGANASGRIIYVPAESVEAYKAATNWSEYAADIVGYHFDAAEGIITFTINETEYQAEEGMTWEEWCNSKYSTSKIKCISNEVNIYGDRIIQGQTPSDIICNGCAYDTIYHTGGGD